ncbi:MAG: shikimate dehydrogenase [bacterium]
MQIKGTTKLLGVFGFPVAHSMSPLMHNNAIKKMGLDLCYLPYEVKPAHLKKVLEAMRSLNFLGGNVTIPHKQAAYELMDEVSDISRLMGVINTIVNKNGLFWGTTTDPKGFIESLTEQTDIKGKKIIIIGTGGTARTIAFALLTDARCGSIIISGRSPYKGEAIAGEILEKLNKNVEVADLKDQKVMTNLARHTDIIINAASAGMYPDINTSPLDPALLRKEQVVYDTVYNPRNTKLLTHASRKGCKTISGLGMLVYQGMESFKLWTQTSPPVEYFREGLKDV